MPRADGDIEPPDADKEEPMQPQPTCDGMADIFENDEVK